MQKTKYRLRLNMLMSLANQVVTLVCGFLIPRLILEHYGSSVNGLVNSINQFLSLIAFCELGVGAVIQSALYKPLVENDIPRISRIMAASRRFFRIVGGILAVYSLTLMFVYPLFVQGDFDYWFAASLVLIISVTYFGQYFFGINFQMLLYADNKVYIPALISAITVILNAVLTFLLVRANCPIHVVKASSSVVFVLRPLALFLYGKLKYKLDNKAIPQKDEIQQKWNGLAQHISNIVVEHTDVVVLTIFCSTTIVSVYSTYYLVVSGLTLLVSAVLTALLPAFGKQFASGTVNSLFHKYEILIHGLVSFLFCCCSLLLLSFVGVYTNGITDADYSQPVFAIILSVAYFFFNLSCLYKTLIKAAGHYKQTQLLCFVGTGINILISVALVNWLGLIGVAIGTLVSALFIYIYYAWYCYKRILVTKLGKMIKVEVFSVLLFLVSFFALYFWALPRENTISSWLVSAMIVGGITLFVSAFFALLFYGKPILLSLRQRFKKKSQHDKILFRQMTTNSTQNGDQLYFESKPVSLSSVGRVAWRWKWLLLICGLLAFAGSFTFFHFTSKPSYSSYSSFAPQGNVGSQALNGMLSYCESDDFCSALSEELRDQGIAHTNGSLITKGELQKKLAPSFYQESSKTYIKVTFSNEDSEVILGTLGVLEELFPAKWNDQVELSLEKLSVYKEATNVVKDKDQNWIYISAISVAGVVICLSILVVVDVLQDKILSLGDCEGLGCPFFSAQIIPPDDDADLSCAGRAFLNTVKQEKAIFVIESGAQNPNLLTWLSDLPFKEQSGKEVLIVDCREGAEVDRVDGKIKKTGDSCDALFVGADKSEALIKGDPCPPNLTEEQKEYGCQVFLFSALCFSNNANHAFIDSKVVRKTIITSQSFLDGRREVFVSVKLCASYDLPVSYGLLFGKAGPFQKKSKKGGLLTRIFGGNKKVSNIDADDIEI